MIHHFQGPENRAKFLESLKGQKILRSSPAAAEIMADEGKLIQLQPGEVLIEQGGDDTHIYLIITGALDIIINSKHHITRHPGEHVGEMALLDPSQKRSAQVKARELSVVHQMTEKAFTRLADKHPDVWRQLAVELAARLRELNKLL